MLDLKKKTKTNTLILEKKVQDPYQSPEGIGW